MAHACSSLARPDFANPVELMGGPRPSIGMDIGLLSIQLANFSRLRLLYQQTFYTLLSHATRSIVMI
jgi:hypothetical protein